jgi:Icc protein
MLIQFTDTHLFRDPAAELWGVAPDARLDDTVRAVATLAGRPELVLVTGDCSADGSEESYQRLAAKLDVFRAPVYFLPGNHDDASLLAKWIGGALSADGKLARTFESGGWRFVLLDSAIKGVDSGSLGAQQLRWLQDVLDGDRQMPTMVALHHAPLPVGSPWLDTMKLEDGHEFVSLIDRFAQVRAVLFGHVHQTFEARRNGTLYASAPSTFYQFLPGSMDFAGDDLAPGARIVQLAGLEFETCIVRVDEHGRARKERSVASSP